MLLNQNFAYSRVQRFFLYISVKLESVENETTITKIKAKVDQRDLLLYLSKLSTQD